MAIEMVPETRTIEVYKSDLAETSKNVRKALQMTEFNEQGEKHRVIRIYEDGTAYINDTDVRYLCDNVAYNAIFRSNAALVVDGIILYEGNVDKEKIPAVLTKLLRSDVSLTTNQKKHYAYA